MTGRWACAVLLTAVVVGLACSAGCTTVVVPPENPSNASAVYLLDHAGHASLYLPGEAGGLTRYAYGDLRWYGLGRQNLWTGASAMLWPTRAVLERRKLGPPDANRRASETPAGEPGRWFPIQVGSREVRLLRSRLDAFFDEDGSEPIPDPTGMRELVEHPRAYTVFSNSNAVVADWLTELGCTVHRGSMLLGDWEVRAPEE